MRATLSYTVLRLGLFVVVFLLLYLAGARSVLLLAGAILISGLISYFAAQRAALSDVGRRSASGSTDFRERLDAGTRVGRSD